MDDEVCLSALAPSAVANLKSRALLLSIYPSRAVIAGAHHRCRTLPFSPGSLSPRAGAHTCSPRRARWLLCTKLKKAAPCAPRNHGLPGRRLHPLGRSSSSPTSPQSQQTRCSSNALSTLPGRRPSSTRSSRSIELADD